MSKGASLCIYICIFFGPLILRYIYLDCIYTFLTADARSEYTYRTRGIHARTYTRIPQVIRHTHIHNLHDIIYTCAHTDSSGYSFLLRRNRLDLLRFKYLVYIFLCTALRTFENFIRLYTVIGFYFIYFIRIILRSYIYVF